MLALCLALIFQTLALASLALGARGAAGVSLQLGRLLFLLFVGLTAAALGYYAAA
jgi:hypothetical protein